MIGTQLGSYRVIELLAEGGMGAVYIARHELMQREAVIKVLLPALSSDQAMVQRFLNEARAATQIHHAGIVEIFDMGYLPSGQAYIAMERMRGETLAARLRQGPLWVPQVIALARQLAGALGAAHDAGIVHRDLKPDNLFLCRDASVKDPIVSGGERLKILDFGIAKLGRGAGPLATVAGSVFGTPAYMSPEQCTSSGAVDHRSDLYAMGCILFEALCGRPPFGFGGIELIAAHMRDPAPDPLALAPSTPPALGALLLRLLEKDPARRPQSCAEVVAALDQTAPSAALTATLPPRSSAPMSAEMGAMPSGPIAVAASARSNPPLPTPFAIGQQVTTAPRQRGQPAVLVAIAGVVALAVVGAVVFALGNDDGVGDGDGAAPSTAAATDAGAVEAAAPPAPADAAPPAPSAPPRRRHQPSASEVYGIPVEGNPYRGSPDALVTIVYLGEYACPFCEKTRATLAQLLADYRGDLRVVHKDLVVHPQAAGPAAAAACAAHKQGKFEAMDTLLWEQAFKPRTFDAPHLEGLAKQAGLDLRRYRADIKADCPTEVAADMRVAQQFAVNATPSFFINGRFLMGAQPLARFKALVDEELTKARQRVRGGAPRAGYYDEWVVAQGLPRFEPPAEAPAP